MAGSWFMQESDGRKPEWLGFNSFSSNKKQQILLKIIFSKSFQKIGKRDIGLWFITVYHSSYVQV